MGPLKEPLNDSSSCDGVFVDCRLASDEEPDRRVWKITMRTEESRGELVYQAAFTLPPTEFSRVKIPFDEFQLVRGPRMVPNAPKLNVTNGVYQVGISLSKFKMGINATQLENFRPGFFDLHIQRIGFYSKDTPFVSTSTVSTLSKEEAEKRRPLLLKVLLPILKVFFSETAQRRKLAMKILTQKRGISLSMTSSPAFAGLNKLFGFVDFVRTSDKRF